MLESGTGNMVTAAALAASAVNNSAVAMTVRLNKAAVPVLLLVCARAAGLTKRTAYIRLKM
jgi:hypothetical protein